MSNQDKALAKILSDTSGPDMMIRECRRGRGVSRGNLRQDSSQHSVACTSTNERGKGSASNYTEIMAISWNHGNSSQPAPHIPTAPLPSCSLILHPTKMNFILKRRRKSMQEFLSANDHTVSCFFLLHVYQYSFEMCIKQAAAGHTWQHIKYHFLLAWL